MLLIMVYVMKVCRVLVWCFVGFCEVMMLSVIIDGLVSNERSRKRFYYCKIGEFKLGVYGIVRCKNVDGCLQWYWR